jgi:acetyl-CoA carboxylase biotin carboxyl carrier protein
LSPRRGRRDGDATARPGPAASAADERDTELLELIDHLGRLLERSDLAELEVEAGSTSIVLRRPEPSAPATAATADAGAAQSGASAGVSASADDAAGRRVRPVVAPLTGIFYAAPTPEAPPFVNVGVEVVVGQVIGLIEAMKLFNEIKSDVAGRVHRVVAESGQLVKARDPLIEVAPGA